MVVNTWAKSASGKPATVSLVARWLRLVAREMAAAPARLRTRPYSDPYERRSMMMASAYQDDYYEE